MPCFASPQQTARGPSVPEAVSSLRAQIAACVLSSQRPQMPLQVFSQGSAGNMLHATPRSSTDEFSVKLVTVAYDGPMFRS